MTTDINVFGHNPEENIVAVEVTGGRKPGAPCRVSLFTRSGAKVEVREEEFSPFMVLEDELLLKGFGGQYTARPLAGHGPLAARADFASWRTGSGRKSGSRAGLPLRSARPRRPLSS